MISSRLFLPIARAQLVWASLGLLLPVCGIAGVRTPQLDAMVFAAAPPSPAWRADPAGLAPDSRVSGLLRSLAGSKPQALVLLGGQTVVDLWHVASQVHATARSALVVELPASDLPANGGFLLCGATDRITVLLDGSCLFTNRWPEQFVPDEHLIQLPAHPRGPLQIVLQLADSSQADSGRSPAEWKFELQLASTATEAFRLRRRSYPYLCAIPVARDSSLLQLDFAAPSTFAASLIDPSGKTCATGSVNRFETQLKWKAGEVAPGLYLLDLKGAGAEPVWIAGDAPSPASLPHTLAGDERERFAARLAKLGPDPTDVWSARRLVRTLSFAAGAIAKGAWSAFLPPGSPYGGICRTFSTPTGRQASYIVFGRRAGSRSHRRFVFFLQPRSQLAHTWSDFIDFAEPRVFDAVVGLADEADLTLVVPCVNDLDRGGLYTTTCLCETWDACVRDFGPTGDIVASFESGLAALQLASQRPTARLMLYNPLLAPAEHRNRAIGALDPFILPQSLLQAERPATVSGDAPPAELSIEIDPGLLRDADRRKIDEVVAAARRLGVSVRRRDEPHADGYPWGQRMVDIYTWLLSSPTNRAPATVSMAELQVPPTTIKGAFLGPVHEREAPDAVFTRWLEFIGRCPGADRGTVAAVHRSHSIPLEFDRLSPAAITQLLRSPGLGPRLGLSADNPLALDPNGTYWALLIRAQQGRTVVVAARTNSAMTFPHIDPRIDGYFGAALWQELEGEWIPVELWGPARPPHS